MMILVRKAPGFTLIEVLVALATMAIAFVALWGLHFSSFKTDIRNRNESQALHLAHQKLEELRSLPFSSIMNGADSSHPPFAVFWTVTSPQSWRKEVVVTVEWPERVKSIGGNMQQDTTRRIELGTIIVDLE